VLVLGASKDPSGPGPLVFMPIPQGEYQGGSFTAADPGIL